MAGTALEDLMFAFFRQALDVNEGALPDVAYQWYKEAVVWSQEGPVTPTVTLSGGATLLLLWNDHGNKVVVWSNGGNGNVQISSESVDADWPIGGSCLLWNGDSTDTLTITESAGLTTVWGTGAAGGRKLAPGASALIYKQASDTFYIDGRLTE